MCLGFSRYHSVSQKIKSFLGACVSFSFASQKDNSNSITNDDVVRVCLREEEKTTFPNSV
jgi:hypothetical protein